MFIIRLPTPGNEAFLLPVLPFSSSYLPPHDEQKETAGRKEKAEARDEDSPAICVATSRHHSPAARSGATHLKSGLFLRGVKGQKVPYLKGKLNKLPLQVRAERVKGCVKG